jgi:hypothetical protein
MPGSPVGREPGPVRGNPWRCADEIEEFRHKTFFQYAFSIPRQYRQITNEYPDANWPVEGWERRPDEYRQMFAVSAFETN